ncbi:methyl-accepting chemotaxis protein [Kurthia massiliensis]|nr:methyl-accepting chemotaxis protein [Kurthia massiliensis]
MKNLKVRSKLILIMIVSLVISGVISIYGFTQAKNAASETEVIYKEKFIPNNWISAAVQTNLHIDSILVEMMLSKDKQEREQYYAEINDGVDEVLANFATYEKMDLTKEERTQIANFYDAVDRLTGNQDQMIKYALAGKSDAAYKLYVDIVRDARSDLIDSLQALNKIKEKQVSQISENSLSNSNKVARNIIVTLVIGYVVLITLSIIFTRLITRPLREMNDQLEVVRNGDLRVRSAYDSKDEIGQVVENVNTTVDSLQHALIDVKQAVTVIEDQSTDLTNTIDQTSDAATQVAKSTSEIAEGSEHTKRQVEYNTEILQEVTHQIAQIGHTLNAVDAMANKAQTEANVGTEIVHQNVAQMETIQQSIATSNEVITNLSHKVSEVDEILKVINSISEQTNLLALNAAIEAARAGENGKGFAVVADEVRKLAEQSLQSTKSISTILANIKEDTNESVNIMRIVQNEADSGRQKTEATSEKFNDILESTSEVAPKVEQMSQAMLNMEKNFERFTESTNKILSIAINNAATSEQVSAFTQEQAAAMEQMQNAAQQLYSVARNLNDITNRFEL